ncbi:ISL3 family transposase [Streptomyces pseudoechinosporeus]
MAAFRSAAEAVTQAPLADIGVLGIDETRRGKARWEKDPETGKWSPAADRWHTGFIDAAGHGGLLGQIEGRATGDVLAWLAGTPLAWRQGVRFVAIDMSPSYRAAIRTGLPHATVVVDHFHVVQLANKTLNLVRRRLTRSVRGRRGRAGDPEWKARRKLLRNREDLTDAEFERMWNPLLDQGPIGQALLVARDRSLPEHRHQQRQERGDQPRDQVRRPLRLRLPHPDQPAPPRTLRHHPPSPRTPPHRITSKTRFALVLVGRGCRGKGRRTSSSRGLSEDECAQPGPEKADLAAARDIPSAHGGQSGFRQHLQGVQGEGQQMVVAHQHRQLDQLALRQVPGQPFPRRLADPGAGVQLVCGPQQQRLPFRPTRRVGTRSDPRHVVR